MMLKLIRLEWAKIRWRGYARNAAIAIALLAAWCIISLQSEYYETYSLALGAVGTYVRTTFYLFSSVLLSRMVIDEYRNKTMDVLFLYPVPRWKWFVAKLALVVPLTFVVTIAANAIVAGFFLLAEARGGFIPEPWHADLLWREAAMSVWLAVLYAGISIVPLYFGMLRKSMPALLVSSFVIGMSASGINSGELEAATVIKLALTGVVLGLMAGGLAIRIAEKSDIGGA